jgi:hypothetical protein
MSRGWWSVSGTTKREARVKVVYLDQNKWIDVARAFHGKASDAALKAAFEDVQRISQQGAAVFPLSWVHYLETAKSTNHERRKRLGTVMWELSRGHTMASYGAIVRFELELVFAKRFPGVVPRDFRLVSRGVAYAFGERYDYRIPEEVRRRLPAGTVERLEGELQKVLEKAVITGEGPGGIRMPSPNFTRPNESFKRHLKTLPERDSLLPSGKREDFLHAIALDHITDSLNEMLDFHGLSWQRDLEPLGREGLTALVQDMPSRRTEVHLHRQIIKNPNLKPKDNDLEDWSWLGPATAHCDIVVCEKHFANLLHRDGFQPNSRVITDLRMLPDVLTGIA